MMAQQCQGWKERGKGERGDGGEGGLEGEGEWHCTSGRGEGGEEWGGRGGEGTSNKNSSFSDT